MKRLEAHKTKTWLFDPHHLPACFSPQTASLELLPCFFACLGDQKRDVSAADLPEEHAFVCTTKWSLCRVSMFFFETADA
jgi:hypothetical protein